MNKQELIEKYEYELKLLRLQFGEIFKTKVYEELLDYLKQLDEPQKPVVPQFVADWYEKHKNNIDFEIWHYLHSFSSQKEDEFKKWMNKLGEKQIQTLVNVHQFGYTVEVEKRYRVRIKSTGQCLGKYYINNEILSPRFIYTGRNADEFTRKELEEAGFGWVFSCEGIEVEEVEE